MAPRIQPDERTIDLSVADLLETTLLRTIGFAHRGGYERLWMGQAIHSRYQEDAVAADGTYRREVALALTFPHRGWQVTLRGRADGLRRDDEGALVVEEIKSVRRAASLAAATRELYARQALLYAWMLDKSGDGHARAELVLIEIGGGEVERQDLEAAVEDLEGDVRRRLDRLLSSFEARQTGAADRRAAAARLTFPHSTPRPGQPPILDAAARALERGEHLLLQAPTGLGKTAAVLFPALRHVLAHDRKLFVLTAKTLQQEMATTVLGLLNREGSFRTLRMRAKAKMCARGEVLCHEDYCAYARDYALKMATTGLLRRLRREHRNLDPDAVFAAAKACEACPFEVSLDLASEAEVVVCDYNYAFEPYVSFSDFGPQSDLSESVLVIDEVHNLVERGRGYYSPRLDAAVARRTAEGLAGEEAAAVAQAARLCRQLGDLVERAVADGLGDVGPAAPAAEAPLPEDELWTLRPELDAAFVDYLEHRRETRTQISDDPFVGLYFGFARFVDALLVSGDEAFSRCVERDAEGVRLRILCKDPSRFLGRILNRCHAVIGLSATLSPPEFYRDLLGFDEARTSFLSLPSPFPTAHRRVVIDGTVTTAWKQRDDNYAPIARRLAAFAEAVPGNTLALFPSYDFLARVAERLEVRGRRVLIQDRASNDEARQRVLETLRAALFGDVLLLAVAGGVFAEGVDYPGDMLRAVAVVGPCLPAVTLDQELLRIHFEERFARGFEYAFVVPGMRRVVQAAGRLIRSADDTGVIALLDRRFLRPPYRGHLPDEWLNGGEPEALVGDPAAAAREFFASLDPRPPGASRAEGGGPAGAGPGGRRGA